jgi:hypothetical protein
MRKIENDSICRIIDAGPSRDSRRRLLVLILSSPGSIFLVYSIFLPCATWSDGEVDEGDEVNGRD